ncbi:MAG: hypothetical protein UIH18_08220 [Fibrobacteraceae bacterium]|nr:hypothetical protein [Fibrobacteraceae bacterium]
MTRIAGKCRTSDGIASVVSLHRNDKNRGQVAGKCRTSKQITAPCIQHGS